MITSKFSTSLDNSWHRILTIVNERTTLTSNNIAYQFKKMRYIRLLFENILVFLLQYTGLNFAFLSLSPTPLYFASGTACAFMFLRGYSVLPGITLGSFIATILTDHANLATATYTAIIYSLQAFLLLWGSHQFITPTLLFQRITTLNKFFLFSGILTATSSFLLLYLNNSSISNGISAWLANFNGTLIFAFALIAWDAYFPQYSQLKHVNKTLLSLVSCTLIVLVFSLMMSQTWLMILTSSCLWLMNLFFISFYYRWCGFVTAVFISSLLISLAAYMGLTLLMPILFFQTLLLIATVLGSYIAVGGRVK